MILPDKLYTITEISNLKLFPWIKEGVNQAKTYRKYQHEIAKDLKNKNYLKPYRVGKVTLLVGINLINYIEITKEKITAEKKQLIKNIKKIV